MTDTITMTDIFHDWKKNRFIVAPEFAYDLGKDFKHVIVLTDIAFWAKEVDNLVPWCLENGCRTQGMTVEIPDDKILTLFCLRWS